MERVNLSAIKDRKWAKRMEQLGCTPEQIETYLLKGRQPPQTERLRPLARAWSPVSLYHRRTCRILRITSSFGVESLSFRA
jgi:hypothetical protein